MNQTKLNELFQAEDFHSAAIRVFEAELDRLKKDAAPEPYRSAVLRAKQNAVNLLASVRQSIRVACDGIMRDADVRVVSMNAKRRTMQIVIKYRIDGKPASVTRHLREKNGVFSGWDIFKRSVVEYTVATDAIAPEMPRAA